MFPEAAGRGLRDVDEWMSPRVDISQVCSLDTRVGQGPQETCPASHPHPGSTEGPSDWFPPSLFWSESFPEFLFATFVVWLGVPWVKNTGDNTSKKHLVKQ